MTRIIKTQDEKRESTVSHSTWLLPVVFGFPLNIIFFIVGLLQFGDSEPRGYFFLFLSMAAGVWLIYGLFRMFQIVLMGDKAYKVVQREEYVSLPDGTDTNTLPSSTYQNTSHTTH